MAQSYRQVTLRLDREEGNYLERVCWIPTEFAVIDKKLRIDKLHGIWRVAELHDDLVSIEKSKGDEFPVVISVEK